MDDEPLAAPPAAAPIPLRRNRNFRLLWIGQVLSDLGTQVGTLAYPLLVFALTGGDVVLAGLVGTVGSAAAFVVRLPAGSLADRVDRRRAMVVCDLVRMGALVALGVLVALRLVDWELVMAVAVIDRTGDTLFTPASLAALPAIVDDAQLERAWATTEARQFSASLAGPALGGVLYGVARFVPFFGDALSYGISSATSGAMRGDFSPQRPDGPRKGLWREAFDGIRLVVGDGVLRAVMVQAPIINFAFNGIFFAVILAMRHHGIAPSVVGLTQSGIVVGGLLGALVAPRIQGRLSLQQLVVALTAGGAVLFAVAALLAPSPLMALPIAVTLVLSPTTNAALFAMMLRRAPESMRGRVNNAVLQAALALATLSPLAAGLLVAHVSSHLAIGAFAAVLGVSAVLALSLKGLRIAEAEMAAGSPAATP